MGVKFPSTYIKLSLAFSAATHSHRNRNERASSFSEKILFMTDSHLSLAMPERLSVCLLGGEVDEKFIGMRERGKYLQRHKFPFQTSICLMQALGALTERRKQQ